jgi:DNA-binding MarR family transcriptional regulator
MKMNAEGSAQELARRLTRAKAGSFRAAGDTVTLATATDQAGVLQVIDAGAGRTEQVLQALHRGQEAALIPVIVGRHFTRQALEELDAADANYMDDRHLRVRLQSPDILVHLHDATVPRQERSKAALRLSGAAGGVALALLADPAREWKVSDLAVEGRVSLGAAQNTLVSLEAEGLIERRGRGPATRRRLTDSGALLDRYAHDAAADRKLVARGFILNDGALPTMRAAFQRLSGEERGMQAWFTGVAAAQLVAPHVTTVRLFEAWVITSGRPDMVLEALGAMPVEEGANLVLMRGHPSVCVGSECRDGIPVVSVFRMYADVLADLARGEEQADYLRETVIGF